MNNNSGTNTIILVIILIVLVVGVVWVMRGGLGGQEQPGLEINLPAGNTGETGGTE